MDAPRCPGLGQIEPAAHALSLLERWGQTRAGSVLTCHWKLALAVASRLSLGPEQPQPLAETTYALGVPGAPRSRRSRAGPSSPFSSRRLERKP